MHMPQRYYLITYPRTGSNLLIRMLSLQNQPQVSTGGDRGGYIFLPAIKLITELGLRKKEVMQWTMAEKAQVKRAYQACFDEFQHILDSASQDHYMVYVKEHIHFLTDPMRLDEFVFGTRATLGSGNTWLLQQLAVSSDLSPSPLAESPLSDLSSSDEERAYSTSGPVNGTFLPDEFLRTWQPTFLVRHPALAFPSLYRAVLELEGTGDPDEDEILGQHCMTLRWTRTLYDWYANISAQRNSSRSEDATWPIILDADDIILHPELVVKYCKLLGMDSRQLSFSWNPTTDNELQQMDPVTKRYLDTLLGSRAPLKHKVACNMNLNEEVESWHKEFGSNVGKKLERLVRDAMPDYEFLKQRRLKPDVDSSVTH